MPVALLSKTGYGLGMDVIQHPQKSSLAGGLLSYWFNSIDW